MKKTGRINPITQEEVLQAELSDIDFWETPWNDLTDFQKCTYLSYKEIGFLGDLNRDMVMALYYSDSHKNR